MSDPETQKLDEYYREAASWSEDRQSASNSSRRTAWIVAVVAGVIALLEAIALVFLLPLKTVVPYTLLVDRQTGYVEALKPLERQTIAPDAALVRSFLVQYVIERESFDIDSFNASYRKVALWSADEARNRYVAESQSSNPQGRLATLPRKALVEVQVRSVSSLDADTSLVRFSSVRTDLGASAQMPQYWAAVIKYRFSGAAMSAEDRMVNPLGFQVLHYRRDAETVQGASPADAMPMQQAPASATVAPANAQSPSALSPSSQPSQQAVPRR